MINMVQILLPKMLVESGKNPLPLSERIKLDSIIGQNGHLRIYRQGKLVQERKKPESRDYVKE